jgi:hypothetical protein
VTEPAITQVLPHPLDRIEFGAVIPAAGQDFLRPV